ncbi:hypothetical protein [Pseudoalteromonas sp. TAB23]|uniref:hypothetical protein n=1 Tax=Pseudoalteromonas sp. TAB23 TaxID=1938595 RepID=UPI00041904F4|nr:hypothetical protein [Pseudoalteromonas sp. TAB23]
MLTGLRPTTFAFAPWQSVICHYEIKHCIHSLPFSSLSYAGGDHFPIFIKSIEISGNKFSFIADTNFANKKWMDEDCKSIKVSGTYDTLKWFSYSAPMSKDSHKKALKALLLSKNTGSEIYFGYIGAGLIKEANCNYQSKGLMYENDMVYSIYHSI